MFLFRLNHHAVVMSRDSRPAHSSSVFLVQLKEIIELSQSSQWHALRKRLLTLCWFGLALKLYHRCYQQS